MGRLGVIAVILVGFMLFASFGCGSTTTKANTDVRAGMSASQVSGMLGKPTNRTFRGDFEAWQYDDIVGFGQCEYITIWFEKGKVLSMSSRRGSSVAGCGLGSSPVNWNAMPSSPNGGSGNEKAPPPELSQIEIVSGSCFFVSNDGLLITNNHVVEGKATFRVFDSLHEEHDADLLKIDPANDLALLTINSAAYPLGFAAFGSLSVGDEIFAFGYPMESILGSEPKFTDGVVSSITGLQNASNIFQMTVPVQPGNSGGPVVNYQGQVVGVVTSTAAVEKFFRATGAFPQNINWAVKSEYAQILTGIDSTKTSYTSRKESIETARKGLCQIQAE